MSGRAIFMLISAAALALAVYLAPGLVAQRYSVPTPILPTDATPINDGVDAFVHATMARVGATEAHSEQDERGVLQSVYRLPTGADAMETAGRVRTLAQADGVELYVTQVHGLNAEVRVYGGRALRHQLLLVPDLPNAPKVPASFSDLERPLLAVVIVGLGLQDEPELMASTAPLTLAIQPFTPFALRLAQSAVESAHEILAHLPSDLEGPTALEALQSIPYANGMWSENEPTSLLPEIPFGVVVYPVKRRPRQVSKQISLLAGHKAEGIKLMETFNQVLHISVRDGVATLIVDRANPELNNLLQWMDGDAAKDFRMVLASEAVRPDDYRGSTWKAP